MGSIECKYPWGINVSRWSKSLSACMVTEVIDESDGSDVMSTVMPSEPGEMSEHGCAWPYITLDHLENLTSGRSYKVVVQFTGNSANLFNVHFRVKCR
jgi:hypothetical protein